MTAKIDVLFYHLEHMAIDKALPQLIERTLQRGWRAVIQVGAPGRLEPLNMSLWTSNEDSFLPHGTKADGHAAEHPVYLTDGSDNPNGATVRFFVEGALPETFTGYERFVILFDGRDGAALTKVRHAWKAAKTAGTDATYWQQSPEGRWEKKA